MKRTRLGTLLTLLVVGFGGGLLTQMVLSSSGRPGVIPPYTLALVLVVIGVLVVLLALPVRRSVRGAAEKKRPVDPFYALRVLVLAKASALTGALGLGVGSGFVAFMLTRSVTTAETVGSAAAMVAGALVLLVGGLVAESMCRLPPDDGDDADAPAGVH